MRCELSEAVYEVLLETDPEYLRRYPSINSFAEGICEGLRFFNEISREEAKYFTEFLLSKGEVLVEIREILLGGSQAPKLLVERLVDGFEREPG